VIVGYIQQYPGRYFQFMKMISTIYIYIYISPIYPHYIPIKSIKKPGHFPKKSIQPSIAGAFVAGPAVRPTASWLQGDERGCTTPVIPCLWGIFHEIMDLTIYMIYIYI